MKTIKSISRLLVLAAFVALVAFQSNSFAKTNPSAQTKHVSLMVSGMMCTDCSSSLESSLCKLKGAENVKADYKTGTASLDVPASAQITKAQLTQAVSDAGFTLKEVKFTENPQKTSAVKQQSQ